MQQPLQRDEGETEGPRGAAQGLALRYEVPPIVPRPSLFGPIATALTRRTFATWFALCVVGTLPTLFDRMGVPVSAAVQAFGWGLWLPGAGFVAVGGWYMLLFPVAMLLTVYGFWLWVVSGAVTLPGATWLAAAVAAYFVAGDSVFPYTWAVVGVTAVCLVLLYISQHKYNYAVAARQGKRRSAELPEMLAALDAVAVPPPAPSSRELTPDALAAARYLYDLALQPVGQFEGFTRLDNFQLAALRYQLNYIGYGLALLQCKYQPNFHGYLNTAQQHAIESLTSPQVCAYWKLESLWGNFIWNPDPIDTRDNVMLGGLSLPPITAYAANTGDLRYQQGEVLRFRPFRWWDTTYDHDAHSFVDTILGNWRSAVFFLYPCEPHWVFPICNAYAMCGLIPYDRVNGTAHAAGNYEQFIKGLEQEFLTPDGGMHPELSSLIGISPFWMAPQMQFDNLMSLAQVFNAVHPGYAKRWYATGRYDYLRLGPDGLSIKDRSWESCVDFGNYSKNPGMALASIALAAREHGDETIAEAALAKADELLTRVDAEGVLAYQEPSASANVNLAVSRWARRRDWHDLLVHGPSKAALRGPILTDCPYPDVLVARAMSDGDDLDLVLFNGRQPGLQRIRIERLNPGRAYEAQGAQPASFIARQDGTFVLDLVLDGRTRIHIRPANGSA